MNTFAALADNNRLKIVEMLADEGQLTSTEIARRFSISPPAVSQHLKILREAKLVQMKKDAQKRVYSLDKTGITQISDWSFKITAHWNDRFDRLDAHLKKIQKEKKKND